MKADKQESVLGALAIPLSHLAIWEGLALLLWPTLSISNFLFGVRPSAAAVGWNEAGSLVALLVGLLSILIIWFRSAVWWLSHKVKGFKHYGPRPMPFFVHALDWLCAFGYRPVRLILLMFAVVVLSGGIYAAAFRNGEIETNAAPQGVVIAADVAGSDQGPHLRNAQPAFAPLLYAADRFVPIMNFGQGETYKLSADAPEILGFYEACLEILGWILTTLLALAPIAIFRRD